MLRRTGLLAAPLLALALEASAEPPDHPVWPLTLRDGIPASLPGWDAAPRDPLPDSDENEMGTYTEVSRFFQKIEPSTARQFRIVVQDYGKGSDVDRSIRKAVTEAGKAPGVETAEVKIGGLPAYAVTDRSQGLPTTLVTVVVSPGRLVLGQGSNVEREEAVKLLGRVDYARVAAAK
ncbi:MAG: hypothetical protein ACRD3M_08185 [Thermoanaerobaculia bacterium]